MNKDSMEYSCLLWMRQHGIEASPSPFAMSNRQTRNSDLHHRSFVKFPFSIPVAEVVEGPVETKVYHFSLSECKNMGFLDYGWIYGEKKRVWAFWLTEKGFKGMKDLEASFRDKSSRLRWSHLRQRQAGL